MDLGEIVKNIAPYVVYNRKFLGIYASKKEDESRVRNSKNE